jgi:PKD repeat protein
LWNFGDPSSGAANTSTLQNPTHQYSAQGSYTPQLVIYYQCSSDTVKLPLTINGTSPTLSVTGTFTICKGQSKTFTVTGANTYSWSSASTNSTAVLSPTLTKVYNVSGTNTATGCSSNKSFTVVVAPCTGIEEDNYLNNTVSVYPNPVSGNLTIETKKGLDLVIYNAVGAIVYTAQMPTGKSGIDMTQFQAGVYTLKLSDGTSTKTTRLLKTD